MSNKVYLGRQPIFDHDQRIVGYELLFRRAANHQASLIFDSTEATIQVLENAFISLGTEQVIGDKLAFVNATPELLLGDSLAPIHPAQVVLEYPAEIPPDDEVMARCRDLRRRGFRFAISPYQADAPAAPLLGLCDFVKLDALTLGEQGLKDEIEALRDYKGKIVIERVETNESFNLGKSLGAHYFQGYCFSRPETLSGNTLPADQGNILALMAKIQAGAPYEQLEPHFKRDVGLLVKLLKYVNSACFGKGCGIYSIHQAVDTLGYAHLLRWLGLQESATDPRYTPPALLKTAITRGRFMEILAMKAKTLKGEDLDGLYITGVLSLLDAMLDLDMKAALETVPVSDDVREALLNQQGRYAVYLALAKSCEEENTFIDLGDLDIPPDQVMAALIDSLRWAEEVEL